LQFKRILQDQFIQSWFSDMNKSSRGQFYGLFKIEFKLEPYLLILSQVNLYYVFRHIQDMLHETSNNNIQDMLHETSNNNIQDMLHETSNNNNQY
jgi:hypothetical protein